MIKTKPITGYEGIYSIRSDGFVISHQKKHKSKNSKRGRREKIRINCPDREGYLILTLSKNGITENKKIHRLVAQAFIPNRDLKPAVNHKDGNKTNNNVENLEWVSHSENTRHAYKTGLLKPDYERLSKMGVLGNQIKLKRLHEIGLK